MTDIKNKLMKLLILIALLISCHFWLQHQILIFENSQPIVRLVEPKHEDTTIFFYKDNCNQCRKIFEQVYLDKFLWHKNIQFVNLNQIENRHYISEFQLKSVPTFIHYFNEKKTKQYSGTDRNRIEKIIN